MKFLFISPHFPETYVPFSRHLNRYGVQVLGIGDAEYNTLHPDLPAALQEYYKVGSLEDREQVLAAGRFLADKYGQIDRIESLQERYFPLEAILREELKVPGIGLEQAGALRRKSYMKDKFRAAGVATARGEIVRDHKQAQLFAKTVGYPLIIKLDDGARAEGTRCVKDEHDLLDFFSQMKQGCSYLMEEFLQGRLISYDGLVDQQGRVVFSALLEYPRTVMEVVHADEQLRYYVCKESPPELQELALKVLRIFEVRGKFFHIEFFYQEAQKHYTAVEFNQRPPGLLTTDMWNYSYDMDIYERWARLVARGEWVHPGPSKYFVGYAARKNRFRHRHSHEDILNHCWPKLVHFEWLPPLFRQLGGDVAYIVRSPNRDEMLASLDYIQAVS